MLVSVPKSVLVAIDLLPVHCGRRQGLQPTQSQSNDENDDSISSSNAVVGTIRIIIINNNNSSGNNNENGIPGKDAVIGTKAAAHVEDGSGSSAGRSCSGLSVAPIAAGNGVLAVSGEGEGEGGGG